VATETILSWSGGKDSALTLQALRADPGIRIVGLLTSVTQAYDRISVHGVRRQLLQSQVAALELPLQVLELDACCSNEAYEKAFHSALSAVRRQHPGLAAVAFGDLFLQDVRAYRERLLAGTGLTPLFPLWGLDTRALARRFIADGFAARLVCVDTTQLSGGFAGRAFDRELLDEFPSAVDPCGERGEFHTFVSMGPGFSEPVGYSVGECVLRDGRFMYTELLP
jgi:uncharacterized protein (TIGR00290 family)